MTADPAALAAAQLAAYNAHDLDAFCACYAPDVRVLDATGAETLRGMDAFRARYAALFTGWDDVGATVAARLVAPPHAIDDETWWRARVSTGERQGGRVLVRYTAGPAGIHTVQFFPAEAP